MQSFKANIPAFNNLLSNIDAVSITADAYAQQYLNDLLLNKKYYLNIYAEVLDNAIGRIQKPVDEITMLDFGCGNGLLALFAKFSGIGFVAASDVNAPFLLSAQQLSKQLDLPLDQWIIGNENILPQAFQHNAPDVVTGTDVIEHIYHLDHFFSTIRQLNENMVIVFTTASIAENPIKSKRIQSLQRQDELSYSNGLHSYYQSELAGLSFLDIRKKLIQRKFPQLNKATVEKLASATRGLHETDIYTAVQSFIQHKIVPVPPPHPTNTCDPITGSWTERLLSLTTYRDLYNRHGFQLEIRFGGYNEFGSGLKYLLAAILNRLMLLLGKQAKWVSPYMLLIGKMRP